MRRPVFTTRVADGTNVSEPFRVPAGAVGFAFKPRTTTVDVGFGLTAEEASSSKARMDDGQAFEMRTVAGEPFAEMDFFFFATSSVTIDCVWW